MTSKVVSGMGGAPSGLLKSGTNFASKSGKDWVSYGGRRAALDPALTFLAPLNRDTQDDLGAADTFTRASDGLYLPYNGADWRIVGPNVPRHGNGQLLMEPAITNKCTNYNANPDAALTNISQPSGGGSFSRVNSSSALAAAGLSVICSDGNVVECVSSGPGDTTTIIVAGQATNTNPHIASGWVRKIGTIGTVRYGTNATAGTLVTNTEFQRIEKYQALHPASTQVRIQVIDGARAEFILNQFEQSPVVTSPIVTLGAAGQRAIDLLSWTGASGFFNQAQGMALVTRQADFDASNLSTALEADGILSLIDGDGSLVRYVNNTSNLDRLQSSDGLTFLNVVPAQPLTRDPTYIAVRWVTTPAAEYQVGFRQNGVWTWSTAGTYDGAFDSVNILHLAWGISLGPTRFSDVAIYNEDRGTAWIEANYP